jgi:hypothetical protein
MSGVDSEEWFGTLLPREIKYTREAIVSDERGIRPEDRFVVWTSKAREGKRSSPWDVRVVRVEGVVVKQGEDACVWDWELQGPVWRSEQVRVGRSER